MNSLMLKKNGIPLKSKQGNPISDKKSRELHVMHMLRFRMNEEKTFSPLN